MSYEVKITGNSTPFLVNIRASNFSDGILGRGTTNSIPVFASDRLIKDSQITDDGQTVQVGTIGNGADIILQGQVFLPILPNPVDPVRPLAVDANGVIVEALATLPTYPFVKRFTTLDIVGEAVAGLLAGADKESAVFSFQAFGGNGFQYVVYHCRNEAGTWVLQRSVDEGANAFEILPSTNGSAITFTFKARVTTQNYSPSVYVSAFGDSLDTSYAPTP